MLDGRCDERRCAMKRPLVVLVGMLAILGIAGVAETLARRDISLETPPDLAQQVCPAPVWTGVTAIWKGVTDVRPDKAVGLQQKKGEEPIEVFSTPPPESAFDAAIRELLTSCGMKLADQGPAEMLHLAAQIKKFNVGVEKKLVTGQAKAQSLLTFVADKAGRTMTIDIGDEIESKDVRRGDIKAVTKALQNLFVETLKDIPDTQQMRELK
jgi:Uncharacterized lipoprotein